MRFPDSGLKCVVYIGESVQGRFQLRGTGFLVQVRRDEEPIYYLVTADHVIRRMKDPKRFAIRINDQNGKARELRSQGFFKWFKHPSDSSVDAAVYPWGLVGFPFKLFPAERFVTEDIANQRMIGVGDEVYVVGLFTPRAGLKQITPMVRTGHIAMMASERTLTQNYGYALMHLIEAFTLKGFSGSPVFVHETVSVRIPEPRPDDPEWLCGVGNLYLLGLVHGILHVPVTGELNAVSDPEQRWHTGISQIVPAHQILEILSQPKLLEYEEKMRKKLEEPAEETAIEDELDKQTTEHGQNVFISKPQFMRNLKKPTGRKKRD